MAATNLPNSASSKLENMTNGGLDNSADPATSDTVLPTSDNEEGKTDVEPSNISRKSTGDSGFLEVRPGTGLRTWGFHGTSDCDESVPQEDGASFTGGDSSSSTIIGTASTATEGGVKASSVANKQGPWGASETIKHRPVSMITKLGGNFRASPLSDRRDG